MARRANNPPLTKALKDDKTMRGKVLIEGILIVVISFVSMTEGFRLTFHKDPNVIYDKLGPGLYVFVLSFALMTMGVVYFFVNYKNVLSIEKVVINKEMRMLLISMIVVYAIYIYLIGVIGYLLSTIIFFFLEFRISGVKSWIINVILTLVVTAVSYIVFVQYCNVAFPKGIFL